jgi:hypothetical protein
MIRYVGIFILLTGIIGVACDPPEKVSSIPEITFKSFLLEDYIDSLDNRSKMGTLKFDFIDGDADIGSSISSADTTEESLLNKYNLFLIPFQKLPDGYYDSVESDPVKYIIRYNEKLDRVGQNKTIKGEIKINIQYTIIPPYDTLRYEFYLYDRAMHKSNVAYTSDIGFR